MISISILSKLLAIDEKNFESAVDQVVESDGYHIYLKLKRLTYTCPICGSNINIKEWRVRKSSHSFLYNQKTFIHLKYPRYICKTCNKTFPEKCASFPFRSKVSIKLAIDALEQLAEWTATFESVSKRLLISPTTVQNIFDTYVNPKRRTLPPILCIDEAYEEGQFNEPYMVVLYDFTNKKIVDAIEDRSKWNLSRYFSKISREERENVKVISIDMWQPYADVASVYFPHAMIVIDSFHVMQNIYRALEKVRCRIMNKYKDEKSIEYYLLKNFHDLLTMGLDYNEEKEYNYRLKRYVNRYQIRRLMLDIDEDLTIATNLFVTYQRFNSGKDLNNLSERFDQIVMYPGFIKVQELVPIIQMLQTWKDLIIQSFTYIGERRISNGPLEGLNSQLKKLMRVANGWANFERFRARLMLCYNKEITINPVKNKISKIKREKRGKYNKNRQNSDGFDPTKV